MHIDCINRGDFDDELLEEINPYPTEDVIPTGFEYGHGHESRDGALEHPCLALKKLLSSGTFYYSSDFDLTSRLQDRCVGSIYGIRSTKSFPSGRQEARR